MVAISIRLEEAIAICYLANGSSALSLHNIIFLSKMPNVHLHHICTENKGYKVKIEIK